MEGLNEIKTLVTDQNRVWNELKAEFEANRGAAEEKEARLNARLDEIETKMNRTIAPVPDAAAGTVEQKTHFLKFARTGDLTPDARKALYVSNDTTGGYLALPGDMEREIIKNVTEFSPVRSFARVRTTSSGEPYKQPKRTGTFSATWVGEVRTLTEATGLTYGMESVPTHELTAMVDISQRNLEDSAYNLEAELNSEFTEQFGVAEGTTFVSGNGVSKPEGIVSHSSVTVVPSGSSGDFDGDDLIDLLYGLKDAYWNNARWMFKRATMSKIRKLKANSEYIWSPAIGAGNALTTGVPATILEKPYFFADAMQATGTNDYKSVVVGDFGRYVIVDRLGIEIQRDPYTQNTAGLVRFIARKRVGGQVIQAEAFRILKEATS